MRNETKIGILVIVCIVGLLWGLKFLKGQNILNPSQTFYAEYPYVDMLAASTPVTVSGIQVGVVTDVYLKPDDLKTVVVKLDVENRMKIPKSTIVQIVMTSIMGEKAIVLNFDAPCSGDNCAQSGDYLQGETLGIVESMIGEESVDELMGKLKSGAAGVWDTLSSKMSDPSSESESMRQIKSIISNMDAMTRQINSLLYNTSSSITGLMRNLDSISSSIASNNAQIVSILENAETLTTNLSKADIAGTVDSTKMIMSTANTTLEQFEKTLASTKITMDEMSELFGDMNKSEGSMGKLLKDDSLYNNIESATRNLDLLLQDFRLNPKRYTTILKKKSKEYVLPEDDPAKQ
ncbi:MAG: MCE family protein [Bacteroidia bacterium]|nr:MCE family protein [Bacteroidia bacterium]